MTWLKKNLITLVLVFIMLIGIGLILYPSLSDYWNSFHQSRAIMTYAADVSKIKNDSYDVYFESARKYNKRFLFTGIRWDMTDEEMEEYNAELNVSGTGVMGYIVIPKIDVELPIYHGVSEPVLQSAVGHIEGSSLPVGGEGTHTVLSGHRGLPSARLFTDLDRLVVGDTWMLHILDETLTYEVDQIRIVEPSDISLFKVWEDKDYCTLITCTPYGINSHRLLVRAHRIANASGEATVIADALQIEPVYIAPFLAVPVIILLVIMVLISTDISKRRKKSRRMERFLKEEGLEPPDIDDTEIPELTVLEAARKKYFF